MSSAVAPARHKPKPRPKATSLGDLVDAGLLAADAELTARSPGREHVARVRDGAIVLSGNVYPSLSAAALAATGKRKNGWTFWRTTADGKPVPLAKLREELRRQPGAAAP